MRGGKLIWALAAGAPLRAHQSATASPVLGLAGVMLGALVLRLYAIGATSYWNDELFSIYWVRNGFRFLWGKGFLLETNPPLYYSLLKVWSGLFGYSEFSCRTLSTLASVACIPALFVLGRLLMSERQAWLAAVLYAVWPMSIFYGQEARVYAFLPLLAALLMLALARLLSGGKNGALAVYAGAGTCLLYAHATAPLILASLTFPVLPKLRQRRALMLLGVNLLLAVLWLPEFWATTRQWHSGNISTFHAPDLGDAVQDMGFIFFGYAWLWLLSVILGFLLLCYLGFALVKWRPGRMASTLAVQGPMLFLVLAVSISFVRPILAPRILSWLMVPLCLLFAWVLERSWRTPVVRAFPVLLVVALSVRVARQTLFPVQSRDAWRMVMVDLKPRLEKGALLVVGPYTSPFGPRFYAPAFPIVRLRQWSGPHGMPDDAETFLDREASGAAPIGTDHLVARIRQGAPVTLVLGEWDSYTLLSRLPVLLDAPPGAVDRTRTGLTVISW